MRALGKGSIAELIRIGLLIAWAALWVFAVGLVGVAIAYAMNAAGFVDLHPVFGPDSHIRIDDTVIETPGAAASWPVVVPALLIGAVVIAGALIIVWRLRRLFDSFCSGQPFAKENATHLRAIWITMIAIEIARYLLLALTGVLLANFGGPLAEHAEINVQINLSTWGSILILIVLAEVFREGARMRAEQELTI
jgi:Protein of unknown function (DUF2975)